MLFFCCHLTPRMKEPGRPSAWFWSSATNKIQQKYVHICFCCSKTLVFAAGWRFSEHKAYVLASLGAKPRLFAVFGFFQASLSTNAQHIDFTMLCLRSFRFSSPLPQLAWCHFLHVEQPWPVLSRLSLQKSFFSLVGVFFLTSRDVLMTIENTSLVVRPSIRPVPLVHSDW